MKTFCVIILYAWACTFCFGQTSKGIDSLKAIIESNIADTTKVWAFYELADNPISQDERIKYLQEGLTLAKKLNFNKGITQGIFELAFKNNVFGNWAKGLEIAFEGYNEAVRTKNQVNEITFINMIAQSYEKQRDYKTALWWIKQAIEKLNSGYPNTGNNEWAAYIQSAAAYAYLDQPDSAILCADKSIASAIQKKIPSRVLGYSYEYKGDAYVKKQNFDLALKNYNIALDYLKQDPFSVQELERQIAKMYVEMNDNSNAEKFALSAYNGASKIGNPNVMMDVCEILYKIYEPQSKEKAFPFLKKYQTVKDEIFNKEKFNQSYNIEQEEKRKQLQAEQDLIETRNKEKQKIFIVIFSFLVLLASVLGYFIFQKQKANHILLEQKDKIEKTLTQLKQTQA